MNGLRFPELSEIPEHVDLRDVDAGLESLLASELPDPDGSMRRLADEVAVRLRADRVDGRRRIEEGGYAIPLHIDPADIPVQIRAAGVRRAQRFP